MLELKDYFKKATKGLLDMTNLVYILKKEQHLKVGKHKITRETIKEYNKNFKKQLKSDNNFSYLVEEYDILFKYIKSNALRLHKYEEENDIEESIITKKIDDFVENI